MLLKYDFSEISCLFTTSIYLDKHQRTYPLKFTGLVPTSVFLIISDALYGYFVSIA